MSFIKTFTIGNLSVNAAMPSALEQDEVLSLISGDIIYRAAVAARESIEMGEKIITSMYLSMPAQTKQRVAGILLSKVFTSGTETKITVNDFQGKMIDYNTLLAQLTLWNYADFLTYLSDAVKDVAPAQNEAVVAS